MFEADVLELTRIPDAMSLMAS
ncbi:hypothetical protein ACWDG1_39700 [Streptomyces sp. NPDC001177]